MTANQQPRARHVPMRTCVVCRDKTGKRILTRMVRTENGLMIDPTGKMNGRGAYLCERLACWERAISSDVLGKALRMSLNAEDRERLQQAKPKA
ncbi:MAG: YlxR family protein [Anaerolineae bacterium]|nr:YlxR family protein [Anaerolineae bacterium]